MAIPSGSGTEVLKRASGTTTATTTILTVGTHKIVTVLSMLIRNGDGTNDTDLYIKANDGSADRVLIYLGENTGKLLKGSTFVMNDKIVLYPADTLIITEDGSVTLTYWVSYIEQDWS